MKRLKSEEESNYVEVFRIQSDPIKLPILMKYGFHREGCRSLLPSRVKGVDGKALNHT